MIPAHGKAGRDERAPEQQRGHRMERQRGDDHPRLLGQQQARGMTAGRADRVEPGGLVKHAGPAFPARKRA
jgi:hypothetical protein